jgi:uncharacterized protein YbjT (DUF2867 family)
MSANKAPLIAVIGATGHQGGGVVRALQAGGRFRIRALTRDPGKYDGSADEAVAADLNRPETLRSASEGAYGVFAVTNFWEQGGADEVAQGEAAVRAAKDAGVEHFVWSTLPDVEAISGGKYDVPHFTNKAKVDAIVSAAGFRYHTFVVASFFYQNLTGVMAPHQQQDGSIGWTLPIDPAARGIHAGDITELGKIVAGAFADPETAGSGQYLPLVGDLLSFGDIVATLNDQGHAFTFNRVPRDVFATFYPGAGELAEMFGYFEEHTYLGGKWEDRIALANKVAGTRPTDFATWARSNMPAKEETLPAESENGAKDQLVAV